MPQRSISPLLAWAARHEAETASAALTSQSTSIGSEATLSASTIQPKTAPTATPATISAQPRGVVKTIVRKPPIEAGVAQPKISDVENSRGDQPAEEDDQQQPGDDAHVVDGRAVCEHRRNWTNATSSPSSRRRASS